MNILIKLASDNELIAYEALALAFVLATFDHDITLFLDTPTHLLLGDPDSRIYGMIQSLDLYDIEKAWHGFTDEQMARFDDDIRHALADERCVFYDKRALFDSVLEF
ncbi:hypothetical protein [Moraxella bovis]|uniref:Uncharacterized protein n=1 Tax=Moraxella bovis TaxID=476 RepID=A0A1T0A3E2_MORBO|nr:hypothetical protein [Moraxella bovis]AWY19823.1 hypothetical protein DQF64_04465 [Moraxella bovis]OOR89851.1 hypothetical protein B0182_06790 [Moraxella bovis]UYZ75049.1 hypothetical protein LP093_09785 [Moraxella bovis]UYZ79019.1 hypothetical protein LP115_04065 [Moraxella bovis]UYZ80392.1 hypothetical protein LP113_10145 [Moraxella bovis]